MLGAALHSSAAGQSPRSPLQWDPALAQPAKKWHLQLEQTGSQEVFNNSQLQEGVEGGQCLNPGWNPASTQRKGTVTCCQVS